MSGTTRIDRDRHEDGRYEIRLKGHLDGRWAAWFDGLSLSHESEGVTVIRGGVPDQAALHGLLQKVRDTGLPLVSVTHVDADPPGRPAPSLDSPIRTHERETDMTTAVRTAATKRPPMDSMRKTALVAGILYLITFISVATLTLYGPVFEDPAYILSSGSDAGLRWGALIDVIVAVTGIGAAVTLYPVVRRQNETFALGFVTSRVIEGAMLLTGVVSLLSLASLHQVGAAAGADSTALLTSGASSVGTYNAAFLIGGTLMPAMNALLLGYLMYRSSLVPRLIPAIGLVGGVLMTSSVIGQILGINEKISVWSLIALLPIFAWELSLGLYMAIKGFKSTSPLMVAAAGRSVGEDGAPPAVPSRTVVATPSGAA